jgi:hypothetical protein
MKAAEAIAMFHTMAAADTTVMAACAVAAACPAEAETVAVTVDRAAAMAAVDVVNQTNFTNNLSGRRCKLSVVFFWLL